MINMGSSPDVSPINKALEARGSEVHTDGQAMRATHSSTCCWRSLDLPLKTCLSARCPSLSVSCACPSVSVFLPVFQSLLFLLLHLLTPGRKRMHRTHRPAVLQVPPRCACVTVEHAQRAYRCISRHRGSSDESCPCDPRDPLRRALAVGS